MSAPGLTLKAAVCGVREMPRLLLAARDGSFVLKEGDRVLAIVSRRKAEDLALAIAAGEAGAATGPDAALTLAVWLTALITRHASAPAAGGPEMVEVKGKERAT